MFPCEQLNRYLKLFVQHSRKCMIHCYGMICQNYIIKKYMIIYCYNSAASRCILVPFERYGRPKKCTHPKKFFNTFSIYIFHVKRKRNIVYEYLKTKIFSRDSNILPQLHWTSNIFGHSAKLLGVFGYY